MKRTDRPGVLRLRAMADRPRPTPPIRQIIDQPGVSDILAAVLTANLPAKPSRKPKQATPREQAGMF